MGSGKRRPPVDRQHAVIGDHSYFVMYRLKTESKKMVFVEGRKQQMIYEEAVVWADEVADLLNVQTYVCGIVAYGPNGREGNT